MAGSDQKWQKGVGVALTIVSRFLSARLAEQFSHRRRGAAARLRL
jgi:hypothetical protein